MLRAARLSMGLVAFLTSAAALGQPKTAPLPLKTVRLYEAGVGYFERSGRLSKGSDLTLPVPPSHLDDALKTLVVLGPGVGVSGIEFGSSMSAEMGRVLAGLPEAEGAVTYTNLLRSFKGAAVEVRTDKDTLRGRLVDVLEPAQTDVAECARVADPEPAKGGKKEDAVPCVLERQATLLLLTERSEVRRLRASEVRAVRPTEAAFATRLGSGLDAMSQASAQAQKQLRVLATSAADVTLGYVTEAPVWRPTYRLVFEPAQDRGLLQGWVLVHNDTDEAWSQVRLELVNGRPESFLFPLAAPRYARRELVKPDQDLSTVPQLLGTTVDSMVSGNMWGDQVGDAFGAGGLGLSGVGEGGGGRGEGIGLGSIGAVGSGGPVQSSMLSVGNLAGIAPAEGVEAGALFRYTLPAAIDLRAHGSALLPFLQSAVSARRIAWFAKADGPARSATRLKNDTQQTLPAARLRFFADGGFAGESRIARMKPGESRTVGFGVDLDVDLTTKSSTHVDETRLLSFDGTVLSQHFVRHHTLDYDLVNKSGSGRTVYLSLSFVKNAKVEGADELDFDSEAGKAMAIFKIEGRKQAIRKLTVDEGLRQGFRLADLDTAKLLAMTASKGLPAPQRALVLDAAANLREAAIRKGLVPQRQADLAEVATDLERLRKNVAALRTGDGDADEFVDRMVHKEERIRALRTRVQELHAEAAIYEARAKAALLKLGKGGGATAAR